jgi:cytochrome c oxidase assembly protein subunit 15
MRSFTRYAWVVLAVNLAVVAWGAFVRATGSGAGCGRHWPTCNGAVVPRAPSVETAIELTHRATSGVALLLVVALVVLAVRRFPRRHPVRGAAWASLALILVEALVGAGLVLFGWVADDASPARGWVMAVHLTNTFLLVGALALTADWSAHPPGVRLRGRGPLAWGFALALVSMLLAGVTGAIAALGDTLFPAASLADGLRQDFSPEAHVLLRLRILHPFAAIAAAATLLLAARAALRHRPEERVRRSAFALVGLVAVQLVLGLANVALLAPVWLQVVHLVVADLVLVALVLAAAAGLAPARTGERTPLPGAATVRSALGPV